MRFVRSCPRWGRPAAAAAEMALILPILTVLTLAAVDFSRALYAAIIVTGCAHNGALYACDPATQSQSPYANLTEAVQADAAPLSPLPTVGPLKYCATPNGTYSTAPLTTGYIEVTVRWTFTTIGTYPGIPQTTTLSRSVRMRIIPT